MCMIDGADPVRIVSHETRRARERHRCGECRREIEPGEQYEHVFGFWEGDSVAYDTCAHCVTAREWLEEVCSGFCYRGVLEDLVEHQEDYASQWLGRAIHGMRNGWRRRDGSAMAIPPKPNPASLLPVWKRGAAGG